MARLILFAPEKARAAFELGKGAPFHFKSFSSMNGKEAEGKEGGEKSPNPVTTMHGCKVIWSKQHSST